MILTVYYRLFKGTTVQIRRKDITLNMVRQLKTVGLAVEIDFRRAILTVGKLHTGSPHKLFRVIIDVYKGFFDFP